MLPLTVIVVLNWNGATDTIACLKSLAPVISPSCRVVVVDNGSTDGSAERISGAFPEIELLLLPCNLGYSGGNNAGFRRVMEIGAGFVIFLNNDTIVDSSFCSPLVETLRQNSRAGIAVPKIFYADRPDIIWYAGGTVRLFTGLVRHEGVHQKESPKFNTPGATGYATGCCLAMRCRDFDALGGFDEAFAMYAEDVDLSLRLRSLGMSIEYVPSSKVWHRVSASLQGNTLGKLWKKTLGAFRLFRKHKAWSGMIFYPFLLPFRLLGSVLRQQQGRWHHDAA